jgi:hypothetical protein
MNLESAFYYLVIWSAVGFVAFSLYVLVVFRSGLVYTTRKQDGTLKKRIPLIGYLNMLAFLIIIIGFQFLANYLGLARRNVSADYLPLFLLNYGHYLILFLFDSLVIDGLVLSVWRPGFLHLPNAMNSESMKKHILISIPVGLVSGIVLAGLSTLASYFLLFRL